MSINIVVFVEGKRDAGWTEILLSRAFRATGAHFDTVVCGRKQWAIRRFVEAFASRPVGFTPVLLVDADTPYLKDARAAVLDAVNALTRPYNVDGMPEAIGERIFFATPTFESWFFADTEIIKELPHRNSVVNLDRIYFPDEIAQPKDLALRLFGSPDSMDRAGRAILERMNLGVAVTRSPSLRDFLRGVGKLIGDKNFEALPDANRALGKRLLISLLQESIQSETVIYRTLKGEELTVAELIEAVRNESPIASEYASDLLRVARDQLAREAKRKVK